MSDYPRREKPEGPPKPRTALPSSGRSAYWRPEDEEEDKKRKVRIPVVVQSGGELHHITGERIEYITVDEGTAQDWDDRVWRNGPIGGGESVFDRYRRRGNPASR
ncbi:hypothetical protein [Actinomadura montaniterrae]|uniref:Uncharacterized protein n=1 Tax=Actinomadura montaniterrae TaxID=1803903 RepID=A0A6L3VKX8_9ACTN|nr:hypothetical protein [Actinomadura montaniterrae]KAB2372051.1 hypothetical protein F9B16_30765 [Actinomadura montaniterrae]